MCPLCSVKEDTQEHCLVCPNISTNKNVPNHISYDDIFSENLDKQVAITKIFSQILEQRENLINEKRQDTSLPVGPTGPSTCDLPPSNDHLG